MANQRTGASWEYRVVPDTAGVAHLNALGNAGWEVVGRDSAAAGTLLLKRPGLSFRERVTLEQKRRVYEEHGLPVPADEHAS